MDAKKIMVLVKEIDKTEEIIKIDRDLKNKKIWITFRNGGPYPYNQNNIVILKKPKEIKLQGHVAYVEDIPVYKPELILDFGKWIRITNSNGRTRTIKSSQFSLFRDGASGQAAQQTLAYLRDISQYTSDKSEGMVFLQQEMEKLSFIHPESVLSCYLNQQAIIQRIPDIASIIFPFRFNLSQKVALENALTNSISLIDGPPGTGKTQTILNIIANFVAVQGKTVAVVSSNNEAIKNVIDKMAEQGYGYLTALLGKKENQESFFSHIPTAQVDGYNCEEDQEELMRKIESLNTKLRKLLEKDRERAQYQHELRAWQLEQDHFEEYYARQDVEEITKLPLFKATPNRILSFLAQTSLAIELKQSDKLLYKLKMFLKYGVSNHEKINQQELSMLLSLQRAFYQHQILGLERKIIICEKQLSRASFDILLKEHQQISERLFRKCLYERYRGLAKPDFTKKNFKAKFQKFIKTFPVILSTTHALRQSIPENYLLDYVIIDEASQVDLLTGVLTFSCCRNVIIVGDVKQLPQITDKKIETKLKTAPPYPINNYFQHSILTSVLSLYGGNTPRKILREHYRCHPQIIEFCNQKYYNDELIPYSNTDLSKYPLILYKTVQGNHMRQVTCGEKKGMYNQRELDVTVEEILNNPVLEDHDNIGFVTPYRKQADKAGTQLPSHIKSDTVHKYQGREKDIMIMSTVLDNTRIGQIGLNFVDDPQMINVAVSRAIRQFVLVTDHSLFFRKGQNIGDLIRYIQYSTLDENIIESNIVSVFDLLYRHYSSKLLPLKAKMDKTARYPSEEALRVLLKEILLDPKYCRYSYARGVFLRNLLKNVDLLTLDELSLVNNRSSLDFVVFYKQDKSCKLVIEVDGFAYHENKPEQLRRDALKDSILAKYQIPILRCPTNGSKERERIQEALDTA